MAIKLLIRRKNNTINAESSLQELSAFITIRPLFYAFISVLIYLALFSIPLPSYRNTKFSCNTAFSRVILFLQLYF